MDEQRAQELIFLEIPRGGREILRCAQNDSSRVCHSERSEESLWASLLRKPDLDCL